MKKTVKLSALIIVLMLVLCSCGKGPEKHITGSWYTEQNGVRMTVAFGEDKVMTTFCTVTDMEAAEGAGVNPDIVSSKNISCLYEVEEEPDLSGLSGAEQELLAGKMAITSYLTEEDVKNNLPGETIYFTVEGDTLTTCQRSGTTDSATGIPEYSETKFTKVK